MKRVIFFLSIAISTYSQTYNPNLLSCTLSVEKDTFLLDEPIYVEFKETNIGQTDVMTNRFFFDIKESYYATLIGPDGKEIKRGGGHGDRPYDRPEEGYLLKPDESQYYVIYLNNYYGISKTRPKEGKGKYLPIGFYQYQITHYTNANYMYEKLQSEYHKQNITIDKMPVVSNELTFYIVGPNAEQDKERLAYLQCRKTHSWQTNKEEIIRLYREYFTNYKNSPLFYKYVLMLGLDILLSPPANTQIYYTKEEILNKVKNSYSSFEFSEGCNKMYDDLKNDDRRFTPKIEGYKRIANKYPDTQISKYLLMKVSENEQFKKKWLKSGKTE